MPLPFPEMAEDIESPQEIIGIITLDSPLKGIEDTVTHLSKLILYSVFEVGDTGIGISEEEQKNIWGRFYKVDKARGNAKKSSGQGLAITKQLVELQGGENRS